MNHVFHAPPSLENHRVLLKPLAEEDFELLCKVGLDDTLWKFSSSLIRNKRDLLNYLGNALQERTSWRSLPFTIIDKLTDEVAGCTRYANISPENKRLEIGWTWLGTDFQHTGLNRACKFEMLKYAFETLQVMRVEFKADALNFRSRDAMRKIGAREEGILRKHMITQSGRVRDTVYCSILESEWEDVKKARFPEFSTVYE